MKIQLQVFQADAVAIAVDLFRGQEKRLDTAKE